MNNPSQIDDAKELEDFIEEVIENHYLNSAKVRQFAVETRARMTKEGLFWAGPPEASENSLFIPYSDLGRTESGTMYRVSLSPAKKNTLV